MNKTKSDKFILIIFTFLAIFSFLFFFYVANTSTEELGFDHNSLFDWSEGWTIRTATGSEYNTTLPVHEQIPADQPLVIKKTLSTKIKKYNCLMITGHRQDINVIIGGVLRSSYTDRYTRKIGNSSPDSIILVPLYNTDAGKEVIVRATTSTRYSGIMTKIYIGSEQSIFMFLLEKHTGALFTSVIIIIIGFLCLIGYIIMRFFLKRHTPLIFLFWFSLLAATWCITQSPLRQVFIQNTALFNNLGYACLMIWPIPIFMCMNYVQHSRYRIFYNATSIILIVNYIVQNILQLITPYDFYQMQNISQILTLILLLCSIVLCIKDITIGYIKQVVFAMSGLIFIVIGIIIEAYSVMIFAENDIGFFILLGMFLFIAANGIHMVSEVVIQERDRVNAINASKTKSQFLATMSHEIRTPLNAVLGMNDLILRDSTDSYILDYSRNIHDAGKTLLSIVNDILDFSKIESGKMEIIDVEYSLKSLLRDLVLMIEGRISKKGLDLKLDIDTSIPSMYIGDDVRIKQVVTNLLTNAVKYTESGSITFTVKMLEQTDDTATLYFAVSDTGIGIKAEDIERLSESFVRFDEVRNRNIEGTGLGLSITSQLLTLMNSKLEVDSEYGSGSCFHFTLKQKIVSKEELGCIMDSRKEETKSIGLSFIAPSAKLLVVDDNPMNLTVFTGILKPTRISIDTAASGLEAIECCQLNSYDVIFMDHMMPEMDGITALSEIRKLKNSPNEQTPVIALTANAISGAYEMYINKGFNGYITKPIDILELNNTLLKHLPEALIFEPEEDTAVETLDEIKAGIKILPLSSPNIDSTLAMNYCGNSIDNYLDILKAFYLYMKKNNEKIANLDGKLFNISSLQEFTISVHALKSSSLTIGAKELSEKAKALELAGKDNDTAFIEENEASCRALYDIIFNEIEDYLYDNGIISAQTDDDDDDSAANELPSISKSARNMLKNALDALDEFDYDTAAEIISRVLDDNT